MLASPCPILPSTFYATNGQGKNGEMGIGQKSSTFQRNVHDNIKK